MDFRINELSDDATFRLPGKRFDDCSSINSYFLKKSEPINEVTCFNETINSNSEIKKRESLKSFADPEINELNVDQSFISVQDVLNEINSCDNTLDIYKKINQRNTKTPDISTSSDQTYKTERESFQVFSPSANSTRFLTLEDDESSNSSGRGTGSAFESCATAENKICAVDLSKNMVAKPASINLTLGCFVTFDLNYLKIENKTAQAMMLCLKVDANAEIFNNLKIDLPVESIRIPAFFDGLLSGDIKITPIRTGLFEFKITAYPYIENINLPIQPLVFHCKIKSELVLLKQIQPSPGNTDTVELNFFKNSTKRCVFKFDLENDYISNDTPVVFSIEPKYSADFEPIASHSRQGSFKLISPYEYHAKVKSGISMKFALNITNKSSFILLTANIDSAEFKSLLKKLYIKTKIWKEVR